MSIPTVHRCDECAKEGRSDWSGPPPKWVRMDGVIYHAPGRGDGGNHFFLKFDGDHEFCRIKCMMKHGINHKY